MGQGGNVQGTVARYDADRGFGFVTPDGGGPDVFVHVSALQGADGLREGERVELDVRDGDRGPQARSARLLDRRPERGDRPVRSAHPAAAQGEPAGDEIVLGGVITWVDAGKGYGFLTPDDLFVHASAVHGLFEQGARVEFVVRRGPRGPQAEQVVPASGPPPRSARLPRPTGPGRKPGTVLWFDEAKGYGFLSPDDGSGDVFVHARAVAGGLGGVPLAEGERVEFGVRQGDRGPQAEDVRRED